MGRGQQPLQSAVATPFGSKVFGDEYNVIREDALPDIGTEQHRRRLEAYARGRCKRPNIYLTLEAFCGRCKHTLAEHGSNDGGCREKGCECSKYLPGGGSYTDMHGHVTVQSDLPPGGSLGEREVCIEGLLRHELCHERLTDGVAYKRFLDDLRAKRKAKQKLTAKQLKTIHNILEDGMIETRERAENPISYAYISALNKLHPRVGIPGKPEEAEMDIWIPDPVDYVPTDANGNPLQPQPHKRTGRPGYIIPKGTPISPWGATPQSLLNQTKAALLARAVPEFEVGELHPTVAAAMAECEEHIVAAVGGNTADCVARSYQIHEILSRHGIMRQDLTEEEQQALEDAAAQAGQMEPSTPDGEGGQADGAGSQPMNGQPSGGTEMGEELSDSMGGEGSEQGEEGSESGESGSSSGGSGQSGKGSAGDDDGPAEMGDDFAPEDEGPSGGGGGGGAGDDDGFDDGAEGEEGAGGGGAGDDDGFDDGAEGEEGAGGGGSGDESADGSDEDGGGAAEGGGDSSGGASNSAGGSGEGGGYTPDAPLPQEAQDQMEKEGRGSVSDEELEKMVKKAEKDLADDAKRAQQEERNKHAKGQFEGDDWNLPPSDSVTPQRDLVSSALRQGGALAGEQGQIEGLGRQLGERLEQIRVKSLGDKRFLPTGRLDRRRYGAVVAGSRNAFKNPGRDLNLDMEIDVSIDRSGSVSGNQTENVNQYRMTKMLGVASRETGVPMAIYGWSSGSFSGGEVRHYAYKEKHSNDLEGIDAMFQTGGGTTPTAEGIHFSRSRLAHSRAQNKVMVVITDGVANSVPRAREEVRKAEDAGIQVLGLAFDCESGPAKEKMDEQFGRGNWESISDYGQAPRIVGELIERAASAQLKGR